VAVTLPIRREGYPRAAFGNYDSPLAQRVDSIAATNTLRPPMKGTDMKLQKILVALKPWQRGLPLAAVHARQLAQGVGAQIQLVSSVFDAAVAAGCERGEPNSQATQKRTLASARVELERLARSMRDWGAEVTIRVVWGTPAYEAIVTAAVEWDADLLVVGAHEPETLHTRLTDTDWQLIRRVRCPLLLVKSASFDGYRTILAAVDPLHAHDEPFGLDRAVLDAGRSLARAFDSTLRAVYAYPGEAAFELASAVQVAPGVLYGAENVAALHRRAVDELAEQYGIAAAEVDLVEGAAAEAVIATVAERRAELVVVGASQRRGVFATAVGSTAEFIAGEVPCDVLIVPAAPVENRTEAGTRSQIR
jgi:universal stress protein E